MPLHPPSNSPTGTYHHYPGWGIWLISLRQRFSPEVEEYTTFNQKIQRWHATYIIYILCELHFFQMWWLYSFVNMICTIQYGGNFIISPLKPWSLGTKITSGDNRYFDPGWLFIGRFKGGSVPEMRTKEELSLFVYKPA